MGALTPDSQSTFQVFDAAASVNSRIFISSDASDKAARARRPKKGRKLVAALVTNHRVRPSSVTFLLKSMTSEFWLGRS